MVVKYHQMVSVLTHVPPSTLVTASAEINVSNTFFPILLAFQDHD